MSCTVLTLHIVLMCDLTLWPPVSRQPLYSIPWQMFMCDFTFNSILRHSYSFSHFVREVRPSYVILYDPDVTCVRQLEVHRARSPGVPLRVYFLFYDSSVEEQVCGCGEGVWGECVGSVWVSGWGGCGEGVGKGVCGGE